MHLIQTFFVHRFILCSPSRPNQSSLLFYWTNIVCPFCCENNLSQYSIICLQLFKWICVCVYDCWFFSTQWCEVNWTEHTHDVNLFLLCQRHILSYFILLRNNRNQTWIFIYPFCTFFSSFINNKNIHLNHNQIFKKKTVFIIFDWNFGSYYSIGIYYTEK